MGDRLDPRVLVIEKAQTTAQPEAHGFAIIQACMPQEIAQTGRAAVETGDVPETGNDFHAQILPPERPGDKARENGRSGKRSGLPARSAPHLRVAVFTAR